MPADADLAVDAAEAIGLLAECVRTETTNPPGNEERMTALLARCLEREGLTVEVQPLSTGRANLLARFSGTGGGPSLVLSGHTDTVPPGEMPWNHAPWAAEREGDRLYGLGAADMKSGLAAMAMALLLLRRAGTPLRGDLLLAASAGEEVDCLGARAFVQAGAIRGAGAIVVGEPTGGEVAIAHKGALWLRLVTRGRTAHGSMPNEGVNALLRMHDVVAHLRSLRLPPDRHPLLGLGTMSINTIHAGQSTNVVPDRCELGIDIRTVSAHGHEAIERAIRTAVAEFSFPVEVEVLTGQPPVETDPASPIVRQALELVAVQGSGPREAVGFAYFTDASVYQEALRVPVIIYGPGEAPLCHQPDEWVSIAKYLKAIRFYTALARRYLS
jgi:succinyl-diaminopimelate desuccinylase